MIDISIDFEAGHVVRWPSIRIFVDQDLMEEVQFTGPQQTVTFPIGLEDGEHLIEIEHFDKRVDDTSVDQSGNILADTFVRVKNIRIDRFDLPSVVLWTCKFVPDWTYMDRPENFPDELPQVLEIGPNGWWSLPFYTPVADWFIDRRRAASKKFQSVTSYDSYEISNHSTIDYQLTDDDLLLIKEIKDLLNE